MPDSVPADHVGADERGAETGPGRRGTEGRALVGAVIKGARQKEQNEEASAAPKKWWPYTCLQLNDLSAVG